MNQRKRCKSCGKNFALPAMLWRGAESGLCPDCWVKHRNAQLPLCLDGEYGALGLRTLLLALTRWKAWSDGTVRIGRSVIKSGTELPKRTKRKLTRKANRPRMLKIQKLNLEEETR